MKELIVVRILATQLLVNYLTDQWLKFLQGIVRRTYWRLSKDNSFQRTDEK